jgi:hypothetical protein
MPVIVKVFVPAGVLLPVNTVIVEEPEPVTDVGLKLALEPDGNPLTPRPTFPLNPSEAVTVIS